MKGGHLMIFYFIYPSLFSDRQPVIAIVYLAQVMFPARVGLLHHRGLLLKHLPCPWVIIDIIGKTGDSWCLPALLVAIVGVTLNYSCPTNHSGVPKEFEIAYLPIS